MSTYKQKIPVLLLIILTLLSCTHFYFAIRGTLPIATGYQDTQIFVKATQQFKDTGELYTLKEPLDKTFAPARAVYKFPPTYVLAYLPLLDTFSASTENHAYEALFAIHIARYLIALFLIIYFLGPRKNPAWQLGCLTLFLLASPVYESLYGMTFENLLFFILVLSLVLLKFNRKWPVIIMLSYACLAKIYPAVQLLFFATKRRWKLLFYIAGAATAWIGITVFFIGAEPFRVYITTILPIILDENIAHNSGNAAFFYKLFPSGIVRSLVVYLTILIALLLINLSRSHTNHDDSLPYCLVIATTLLLIPNCWVQYQIILLLPIAVLIGSALADKSKYSKFKIIIALLAWFPMLGSENYGELNLPYYDKSFIHDHFSLIVTEVIINLLRIFSALLLWLGLGIIILLESDWVKNYQHQSKLPDFYDRDDPSRI